MAQTSSIPLIYIAGSSHSGSTLIDLILGSHSRIESVGEAKKIPQVLKDLNRSPQSPPLCSCREPISECAFWKSVLLFQDPGFAKCESITRDAAVDLAMARRALDFHGKSVLLDSSKIIGRLRFLVNEPGFTTTCLHLTRDPRAAAFSDIRKLERSNERCDSSTRLRLFRKHAIEWASLNSKIQRRYRKNPALSYYHLRYEDFVRSPEVALSPILHSVDLVFEPSQIHFRNFTHHNIEGNRLRLQTGSIIRFDSSYLRGVTPFEWLMSSIILLPSLIRFGYDFWRKSPRNLNIS